MFIVDDAIRNFSFRDRLAIREIDALKRFLFPKNGQGRGQEPISHSDFFIFSATSELLMQTRDHAIATPDAHVEFSFFGKKNERRLKSKVPTRRSSDYILSLAKPKGRGLTYQIPPRTQSYCIFECPIMYDCGPIAVPLDVFSLKISKVLTIAMAQVATITVAWRWP